MKITKFEDLPIWNLSLSITKKVYNLTSKKDFSVDFGLRDQVRGAIISVSSNIVEGFEKNNNNEFIRFLKISKGSVGEVRNQLLALIVCYITEDEFRAVNSELEDLSRQIGGFIVYLENKRANKQFFKK
ncbi:MAG: four helix bundle protein [Candidatus Liptonbacteria bacterium]|nr:four helix bundle protein [Candidatus Liptonbacteria bacterium]